jgi:hypothetical protein
MGQRDLIAAVRAAAYDRREAHRRYVEALAAAIGGGVSPDELAALALAEGADSPGVIVAPAAYARELDAVLERRRRGRLAPRTPA